MSILFDGDRLYYAVLLEAHVYVLPLLSIIAMFNFQAIELFRGRIRVSYDVGNYPVSTMFSYELVADGHYHTVELLAVKKNFTLRVDNGLARY